MFFVHFEDFWNDLEVFLPMEEDRPMCCEGGVWIRHGYPDILPVPWKEGEMCLKRSAFGSEASSEGASIKPLISIQVWVKDIWPNS